MLMKICVFVFISVSYFCFIFTKKYLNECYKNFFGSKALLLLLKTAILVIIIEPISSHDEAIFLNTKWFKDRIANYSDIEAIRYINFITAEAKNRYIFSNIFDANQYAIIYCQCIMTFAFKYIKKSFLGNLYYQRTYIMLKI